MMIKALLGMNALSRRRLIYSAHCSETGNKYFPHEWVLTGYQVPTD
jgi:hypothetical protein